VIYNISFECQLISQENPNFVYSILRSHKRFENLRSFTLESGQDEINSQNRSQKDVNELTDTESVRSLSMDTSRRTSHEQGVPDPDQFAIGDSDDEEGENQGSRTDRRQSQGSNSRSPTESRGASIDETLPIQLRGISEKARGKLPVGTLSRQNSVLSISSQASNTAHPPGQFSPTPEWVCICLIFHYDGFC